MQPNQMCIWIACSKAVSIMAEIFLLADLKKANTPKNENNNQTRNVRPIGLGTAEPIRLGE
jgi:hypothetical protein